MTLGDMKKKTLQLIEEISDSSEHTDDPDIAAKINAVTNQIQYELARIKKIPRYKEFEVDIDVKDTYDFNDIKGDDYNKVYQIDKVSGIDFDLVANDTIIKCNESGTMKVEYFVYPLRIDDNTDDYYIFELSDDVQEIMPYGIAADLLKSDVSNAYGNVYANRYEQLKNQLDPRYSMGSIYISEGYDI